MIGYIVKKVFGTKNERELRKIRPMVAKINEFEQKLQSLPEETLREKTAAWKEELSKIQDNADELARRLEEILPRGLCRCKKHLQKDARK
jgi:preprotein translocase subunit SecA